MANNIGTLVGAPIRPFAPESVFAAAFSDELYGGLHCVQTDASRDAMPSWYLQDGMLVCVYSSAEAGGSRATYQRNGGSWTPFGAGDVSKGYVDESLAFFMRSASTGVGLYWNAGYLDVSVAAGGASTFITLTDCPSSYIAGKMIVVNDACTGIEYAPRIWRENSHEVTLDDPSSNILIYDFIELEADAGVATLIDKNITPSSGTTEQSYKFNLDGSTLLKVYGVANGSGGVNSDKGVGVTPYFYIGDPGSAYPASLWRIYITTDSSTDLVIEKRTGSSTWTESGRFK
jgi:hypothetical protein